MLDETLDVGAAPYYNERVHGSSVGSGLRTEQGRETHSVKSSASCFRPDHGKELSTKSITTSDEEAKKPSPTETPAKKRRIAFTLRPRESSSVQSKKGSTTWRSWLSPTDDTSTLDLLRPSYKEGAVETFFRFFYVVLFLGFGTLVVTILWMKLYRRTEFTLETYFGRFQGRVETLEGESVYAFLGVPFGELKGSRFARAAAYVPPMNGTVPHHPGVRCPQPKAEAPLNYTDQLRQENCLYLNIWSPASGCHISVEPCSGVRTVLLFLFSLGFSRGGGDWYDGSAFAAVGGVVVVAPNYRLGLLAFGVPERADHHVSPDLLALDDQLLALQWVRDHIGPFGGNGSDVVLMGAGGGAWSVGAHVYSLNPLVRTSVSRFILHEESPCRRYRAPSWKNLLRATSCEREMAVDSVECLDAKSAQELLLTDVAPFLGPVTFPYRKDELLADKQVLIGGALDQGATLLADVLAQPGVMKRSTGGIDIDDVVHQLLNGPLRTPALEEIQRHYKAQGLIDDMVAATLLEDLLLLCPTIKFGEYLYRSHADVYAFLFRNPAKQGKNTPDHAFQDLDFIFGLPLISAPELTSESEKNLSRFLIRTWATFATTGVLPKVGQKSWPPLFGSAAGASMHVLIQTTGDLEVVKNFGSDVCQMINKLNIRNMKSLCE
ncbi:carboxylesterase 5A [Ixodes scapularis]|uniref:carboxylesterase 5A n=1 Tax=Ixodes scapularis TaxID=6945 RepID=UPI001A9E3BBB|nr:carboxylesterase 5A [Ixodes scapularis]